MKFVREAKSAYGPRNEALLQLLYGTGMTLSEIARITVGQVFGNAGVLHDEIEIVDHHGDHPVTKPVFFYAPALRTALCRYQAWRADHFADKGESACGAVAQAPLIVNDEGRAFPCVRTASDERGRDYLSYPSLSQLVVQLHNKAGLPGGNAESARRSWSVWLATGACGQPPMHLDWLRQLRGDRRMSTTLAAVKKDLAPNFDPQGLSPLRNFMRQRQA